MAKSSIPMNETEDTKHERQLKDQVSNHADRSEKTSWNRKMDNLVKAMAELKPIEDQILDLHTKKIPLYDKIQEIRTAMVSSCIHPQEYLVVLDDNIVLCKFCDKKIKVNIQ